MGKKQRIRLIGINNRSLAKRQTLSGFETILQFMAFFYKERERAAAFSIVRYEDLRASTVPELQRVLAFFGVDNVSDKHLKSAGMPCRTIVEKLCNS